MRSPGAPPPDSVHSRRLKLRMCADLPLGTRPPSPPPALRSQEELEHAAAVEAFVKRSAYMASLNQRVRRGPASYN